MNTSDLPEYVRPDADTLAAEYCQQIRRDAAAENKSVAEYMRSDANYRRLSARQYQEDWDFYRRGAAVLQTHRLCGQDAVLQAYAGEQSSTPRYKPLIVTQHWLERRERR